MRTPRLNGFSLIELMVAMVLGLVLTLGVLQVYLGSSQTSRLTQALARTQENVRFAADMMGQDIRALGNGCSLPTSSVTDLRGVNPLPEPMTQGVAGWEFSGANNTAPGDAYGLTGSTSSNPAGQWGNGAGNPALPPTLAQNGRELVDGSDILYAASSRSHDLNGATVTNAGGVAYNLDSAVNIAANEVIQITAGNCERSVRFYRNNSASATVINGRGNNNNTPPAITDLVDPVNNTNTEVLQSLQFSVLRAKAFFVAEDTNGADPEPSLFVQELQNPNGAVTRELLSGVENMQILYGVGDREGANNYVTADGVTDWEDVVSVRLALLMRSDAGVRDDAETRSFNLAGTQINTEKDDRARLVMMKTIGLRNRLQ